MPSRILLILTLVALPAPVVLGDELRVDGLRYPSVQIIDVREYQVVSLINGRPVASQLGKTELISVSGRRDFNRAESLLDPSKPEDQRKPADAIRAYKSSLEKGGADWLKRLIRYRLIRAFEQSGQIDQAVGTWVEMIDDKADAVAGLALAVPTTTAQKGSRSNALAIQKLQQVRKELENKALSQAANSLLLSLYRKEGRSDDAARLAGTIAGGDSGDTGDGSDPSGPVTGPAAPRGQLEALSVLVQGAERNASASQASQAEQKLQQRLPSLDSTQLPQALYLLARAQAVQSGRAKKINAGLNFMRVVTYFPASRQAPASLLQAGKISQALGNAKGASQAFRAIVQSYPQASEAAQARELLQSLN